MDHCEGINMAVITTPPDITTSEVINSNPPIVLGSGVPCPTACSEFSLTQIGGKDNVFIDSVIGEALNIGAANGNVFKLLGVHEQGDLTDLTGNGFPIASGTHPVFGPGNAFSLFVEQQFHSIQKGPGVVASAFLGYDFGSIRSPSGREIYSIGTYDCPTSIRKHITAITIQQGPNTITRARIERSDDGQLWRGVDVINLPNDQDPHTISFLNSVRSRYWRIRPLAFSGGAGDPWIVSALQLHDYEATQLGNIQDKVWFENRNRDYQTEAITLKGTYDLLDTQTELSRFGIELPTQTMYFTLSFNDSVAALGRPPIIGDIIQLPSETQYSPTLEPILKYMEVTDVGWSTDGFTPGWVPTLLRLILQPMMATEETQDIFGDLAGSEVDSTGLSDIDDGNHPVFQDYSEISQDIEAQAKNDLPQRGREVSSTVQFWEEEEIAGAEASAGVGLAVRNIGAIPTATYTEDAMPPNDDPYTEGDQFPDTPSDKDWHRLTYSGLAQQVPARLYRYSAAKNRWVFMECDFRFLTKDLKPTINSHLRSQFRVPPQDITKHNTEGC